ncbi:MAG: TonB-dependent receptor plug domain-containing protein, partial [Gammaproteobacteria bacterium]
MELSALQLSEENFFTDFPVVLTATKLQQPQQDSPIATTIIDRKMIEASGFTEIADLMRLAPGMLVNYDGNQPVTGYPFLFHKYTVRMQVLVDGRSVYTPIFGEMPWTQLGITIDDIERIEVLRGPSSSSYGPNAMTGVISIITRHASLDRGPKIKINYGNKGLREEFIRYGNKAGKFDYKLSIGNRQSEGFDAREDDTDISIINFRGDYQVTQNDNLVFHLTYNSGEFDQEEGISPSWNNPVHERDILHQEQHVKWIHTFENNNEFVLQYYHQKRVDNNNYLTDPVPLTAETLDIAGNIIFVNENVTTERQNLEISHTLHDHNYSISYGIIFREDMTEAPQYLYQSDIDTISTEQAFINAEYQLN